MSAIVWFASDGSKPAGRGLVPKRNGQSAAVNLRKDRTGREQETTKGKRMVNGHSNAAEWGNHMVAGLIGHIEALMARGLSYAAARAEAVANSVAGPLTLRRVDTHFGGAQ